MRETSGGREEAQEFVLAVMNHMHGLYASGKSKERPVLLVTKKIRGDEKSTERRAGSRESVFAVICALRVK